MCYYHIHFNESETPKHTIKKSYSDYDFADPDLGYKRVGMFGREDYAQHWCDYYNGKITKEEHRTWLGLPNN